MDIEELIKSRHSVRKYLSKSIEDEKVKELRTLIDEINKENELNIQLVLNEREAFSKYYLNYGKINASNYIAMVGKVEIKDDEKLLCIIAIGYGENQGLKRGSKRFKDVSYTLDAPEWYKKGVEYALLAPTAINQQKFKFELIDSNKVKLTPGVGLANTKIDMGIVKYHFELGAGKDNFEWYN